MDFIIVRCHKLLFILFFTLFFNEWGAQAASKRPAILIDIVDDQVTMADEYALVLHSLGAINLVGFVVTEDGEGDSEKVINRLKNLTNKILYHSGNHPQIYRGAKTHTLKYSINPNLKFEPGNIRLLPDILRLLSVVRRINLPEQQKIFYVAQGKLSSLAHILSFDKTTQSRFIVVGNFCLGNPSPSVKRDKAAWRIALQSQVEFISWITDSSPREQTKDDEFQEIELSFHPSHLVNSRFSDSWLLSNLWNPFSEKGYIKLIDKWKDSCMVGLSYSVDPSIFSRPTLLEAETIDKEKKYQLSFKKNNKGKIKQYASVDAQRLSNNIRGAFETWVNRFENGVKKKVILDGTFGYGISDFAAILRLIYSNQIDLRGLTVAPFTMDQLSPKKSLDAAYFWALDFLQTQLQLKTKVFSGAPHSSIPASQMKKANFEARDFILREASMATPANRLHVIMTGPLTNLSLALKIRPQFASRIHVWLIGAEPSEAGKKWTPNHYNAEYDPAALELIMKAPGLKRSIFVPEKDNLWKLSKDAYRKAVSPDDGGWWYMLWYWDNFVSGSLLGKTGLSKKFADFTEVGLVEAFLDPTCVRTTASGFKYLNQFGGTYWLTKPKIKKMNNHFFNAVGTTIFRSK